MDDILPWRELPKPIRKYYPNSRYGRPPMDLKVMLRIYFMQQWHGLSDPAMEDSLYDLKNCGLVCSRERHDTGKVLELVRANQGEHAVATMCRVLGGVHHVSLD